MGRPKQTNGSDEDVGGFRFMLTEEKREESLLRGARSSMDTDEQLLQYISKKRPSEFGECDDFLREKGLLKVSETEEAVNTEESSQSSEESIYQQSEISEKVTQPTGLQITPEEYCGTPNFFQWEEDSVDKEEESSKSSDTPIPTKFFVQQKSDESDVKPLIYRNINVVYEFKSRLKKGTYTIVNRYFSKIRKIDVAIKIIPKIGIPNRRFFKFVPRELDLAQDRNFKHPNIVKFLETYEIGLRIYLMMEYVDGGNLSEYIKTRGRLDPITFRSFFSQLVNAVNYCLDYGICHRKLSTDNCLVTSDYVLKLCDFSYSRPIGKRNEQLDTFCGVLGFTAPEILMCRDYRPNFTESWSCGVILFAMIYGAMPFDSSNFARLLKQVLKPIKYHWYTDTPMDAIMIMYQSISPIDRRWNMRKILGHRWVTPPPPTKGYDNYMKWYKKLTRGPSVTVLRKKFLELMEIIERDVNPLNKKQEKTYQRTEDEGSEHENPIGQFQKNI